MRHHTCPRPILIPPPHLHKARSMIKNRKQVIIIQTRRHIIRRSRRPTSSRRRRNNEILTNHRASRRVQRESRHIAAHRIRIRRIDPRGGVEQRARCTHPDSLAAMGAACVGWEDTPRIASKSCRAGGVVDGELEDFAGVFAHGVGIQPRRVGGYVARLARVGRVSYDSHLARRGVNGVRPDSAGAHVRGVEVAACWVEGEAVQRRGAGGGTRVGIVLDGFHPYAEGIDGRDAAADIAVADGIDGIGVLGEGFDVHGGGVT